MGNYEGLIILLSLGADIENKTNIGHTALSCAVAHGKNDCIIALLERGADFTVRDNTGETVLDLARPHPTSRNIIEKWIEDSKWNVKEPEQN